MMENRFTAILKKMDWGYVGSVAELPGANTQGKTIEETRSNLKEAILMVFEVNRERAFASIDENTNRAENKNRTYPR